jgi:hypothetical protein
VGPCVRGLYTFGSPRVGNQGFKNRLAAHGLDRSAFRVVNDLDIITRVPPGVLYRHVGQLKLIDADGTLRQADDGESEPAPRARLTGRVREVFNAAPFFASSLGRLKIPVPKVFADHAPIFYPVHLWNSFNP